MLDIEFIRQNKEVVKKMARQKNVEVDIDKLLRLDDERRRLQTQIDKLREERNLLAARAHGKRPAPADVSKGRQLKSTIDRMENQFSQIDEQFGQLLYQVPNIAADDTPVGKDETHNKVIRKVGKQAKFTFKPKAHWQLGKSLDLIDSERAAKVAGSRFTYLKGNLVLLQFGLMRWALDILTDTAKLAAIAKHAKLDVAATPFKPVLTPAMVRKDVFAKTGRLDPIEDKYLFDDMVLAGSAEQALAPLHMNEVLKEQDLPLRYVGYSTNFRREAGSYGKDVRGIFRMHQFDKLEMESFSAPDTSDSEQRFFVAIQEHLMQELKLPYQVVAICTGDMGKPDYRQVDLEVWLPSAKHYREVTTSDHVSDFQARRLNIKYQTKDGTKAYVHMNDATVFSQRPLIAILENYQTQKGQVKIPAVLQPYIGGAKYL